jgi:hypothetical protein
MNECTVRSAVRFGLRVAAASEKHLCSSTLKCVNMVGVERYLCIMKVTDVCCVVTL